MRKHVFVFLAVLLLIICITPTSAWLTGYGYRQKHNLTGSTSWTANQSWYEIMFVVNTTSTTASSDQYLNLSSHSTPASQPLDDIRFTDLSDNLYDCWIETSTNTSTLYNVWVEVPSIYNSTTATQIYVYYGNASSSSPTDGNNTFDFFDTFPGTTINTTKWPNRPATVYSIANSWIYPTGSYMNIMSANYGSGTITTNMAFRAYGGIGYSSNRGWMGFYDYFGSQSYVTQFDGNFPTSNKYNARQVNADATSSSDLGTGHVGNRTWDVIRNASTSGIYIINGSTVATITTNVPTRNMTVNIGGINTETKFEWVLARNYIYPEPAHSTWFAEESTPVAQFSANQTTVCDGSYIQLTDLSTYSPTSWDWDFTYVYDGGGMIGWTEATQTPAPTSCNIPGYISINLTVSNAIGTDYEYKSNYIHVLPTVHDADVDFSADVVTGNVPLTVTFTDSTIHEPTAWNWSFGDGSYSSLQNPVHIYTTVGVYDVKLNASSTCGFGWENKTAYINATAAPTPTVTPTTTSVPNDVYPAGYVSDYNISGLAMVLLALGGIIFSAMIGFVAFWR